MSIRRPGGVLLGVVGASLAGCAGESSMLEPSGQGARHVEGLWWTMFWLAAVVVVAVVATLAFALWRRRQPEPDNEALRDRDDRVVTRMIILGGVVLPIVVLLPVAWSTIRTAQLTRLAADEPLEIVVTAHQWWWQAVYPESGAVTANEIHVPVGEPVRLRLRSNDVIHSFWVPEVHGKTDLIPGQENTMDIRVDAPGVYRGQCAEFCGLQHALMRLRIYADPPAEFERWVRQEAAPAAEPTAEQLREGQTTFEAQCGQCHMIRGTRLGVGNVGPDLTHLASRDTLAAGALSNTTYNLARWILDPQGVKPGSRMPDVGLDEDDIQAVVAYLESLE